MFNKRIVLKEDSLCNNKTPPQIFCGHIFSVALEILTYLFLLFGSVINHHIGTGLGERPLVYVIEPEDVLSCHFDIKAGSIGCYGVQFTYALKCVILMHLPELMRSYSKTIDKQV